MARTRDEALLYLDLHPCECGSMETDWEKSTITDAGGLAARYGGACAECGAEREYTFALPNRETFPKGWPTYGGAEPSQLLDAGEWLLVSDRVASNVPPDAENAGHALSMARAAVEEVLKFIPEDQERVPDHGFWTERGVEFREVEPGRFRRERLEVVRDTYLDLHRELNRAPRPDQSPAPDQDASQDRGQDAPQDKRQGEDAPQDKRQDEEG
ncbi:hypothetical protein [Sinosporangium album]|uniref:hypothetical protein n=1 Tax=Sinosporangium album TaxID=504805 RepID=UPI001C409C02|nr:hypothetical protein [Sinosporangium album]